MKKREINYNRKNFQFDKPENKNSPRKTTSKRNGGGAGDSKSNIFLLKKTKNESN